MMASVLTEVQAGIKNHQVSRLDEFQSNIKDNKKSLKVSENVSNMDRELRESRRELEKVLK